MGLLEASAIRSLLNLQSRIVGTLASAIKMTNGLKRYIENCLAKTQKKFHSKSSSKV